MDLNKIIRELRAEHDALSYAISALEAVGQQGQKRRRGRPPKWMAVLKKAEPSPEQPEESKALRTDERKPKTDNGDTVRKAAGRARGHG